MGLNALWARLRTSRRPEGRTPASQTAPAGPVSSTPAAKFPVAANACAAGPRLAGLAQAEQRIAEEVATRCHHNLLRFRMSGVRIGSVAARALAGGQQLVFVIDVDHRGALLQTWDAVLQRPVGDEVSLVTDPDELLPAPAQFGRLDERDLAEKLALSELGIDGATLRALSRKVVHDRLELNECRILEEYALVASRVARARGDKGAEPVEELLHLARAKRLVLHDEARRAGAVGTVPEGVESLLDWADLVERRAISGILGSELLFEAARVVRAAVGQAPAYPLRSLAATRKLSDGEPHVRAV